MGLHIIRKKHDEQDDKNNINIEFNDETSQLIDEMENACNTSLDILNDLLTYEKIDAGVLVLDKVTVDAFSIVYESLKAFHLQVTNNNYIIYIYTMLIYV
jgi:signal transduction histidine kinase